MPEATNGGYLYGILMETSLVRSRSYVIHLYPINYFRQKER